jgi:uncharacterized RDD family membrane protein YckC
LEKAGFFSRVLAYIVDMISMSVIALILMFVFGGFIGLSVSADNSFMNFLAGTTAILLFVIMFALQFIYFGYFWHKSGQTIGMKLVNIKVVRQNAEPMGFWRSALRGTFGYYVSNLIFGLGFLWAAFDSQKRTWHDMIFDTWVVIA